MKNINYYILEKLQKINSKNDHLNIDILSNKYIEQDDLIEYCFKALDNTIKTEESLPAFLEYCKSKSLYYRNFEDNSYY